MSTAGDLSAVFAAEALVPSRWSNGAGFRYGEHTHPYHKVLLCASGSITFHRLDLPAGTSHAATVGPNGVTCWEAARP